MALSRVLCPTLVGRDSELSTNLASRLQSQADAGQVMLTEEVYRRVREWLDAQRIEVERVELDLKGFDAPVAAYRLTAGVGAAAPA